MKVRFDPRASADLDQLHAWIAEGSPRAAARMIERIEAKVMLLETPELTGMGRPRLIDGTRELIEKPYIVVYRIDEQREEIVILAVVHGARDRRRPTPR
jgi:addiction module RelE/StbE family toxin